MPYIVMLQCIISLYFDILFQYAAACNVTDEAGAVVKERECMGKCGSHGHSISYGGNGYTAYFCIPRCSISDRPDSAIESIEAVIKEFFADLEELWASEFGGNWWHSEDDDHGGDVADIWLPFGHNHDDDWVLSGIGDDNDTSWWPLGGDGGWWPFGSDDGGDNVWWWPFGTDNDYSWWNYGGS